MTAGDPGPHARLDHATHSLRLALLHVENDADRLRALDELAQRSVLAATWPNQPEAVRTLTNSDGEQAMPLFSGLDTLQIAARRFGWMNPDGTFTFRELPAREALQSALTQGVNYVVLDLFADHAAEFSRPEIAQVLQRPTRVAAAQSPQPRARTHEKPSSGPLLAAPKRAAGPLLAEIDMPFASERGPSKAGARPVLAEPAPPRRPEAPRLDPRAEAALPSAHAGAAAASAARPQVLRAPSTLREQKPPKAEAPAPPHAEPFESHPFEAPPLPAQPFAAPHAPAHAASAPGFAPMPAIDAASDAFPLMESGGGYAFDSPEPEARPAALEAAAMVAQVAKLAAGDAETQKAAAEVAAMLTSMARKGVTEDAKPSAAQNAAKMFAGLLANEVAADAQRGKRGKSVEVEPETGESPEVDAAAEAEPASSLRTLDPPLSGAVLDAVSDALRKYPEVEWACEVSDRSEVPVVGVRVDPAFQTRANEVGAAVIAAARSRGASVSVLMLNDPKQVRDARALGGAFFPWRKRGGAKR